MIKKQIGLDIMGRQIAGKTGDADVQDTWHRQFGCLAPDFGQVQAITQNFVVDGGGKLARSRQRRQSGHLPKDTGGLFLKLQVGHRQQMPGLPRRFGWARCWWYRGAGWPHDNLGYHHNRQMVARTP